jgi:antitoxin VapB
MAFHVSNETVDHHVRALAELTGQSITDAIDAAVKEKLNRLRPRASDPNYVRDLMEMSDRIGSLLGSNLRTTDELVGYDDNGLPR